jgi:protein HIRA/HIR1
MRFTKPSWLIHGGEKKDHEVYSCSVSPDGSRLATAAGDGHVRIWSTEAILNASNPAYTKPKQLASLSYHSGTVHSVRFSPNGKYLASGADDKIVCVYTLDPGPPAHASFGSNETQPAENWRIFRRLIGHDNDVQDLGWSCDSSILVSVGLDSKVVVWSGSTFERLKTLLHHQSHVKGITFDPANKYFATASDDRSIRVYRFTSPPANATAHDQTSNFMLETTISGPFDASPLTTYFRRCSWSPEGAHIAAANAVNGPVSSVAIIARGSWTSEINLIGHEGPVEVCAFSPKLFCSQPMPTNIDPQTYVSPHTQTIIACAGQDKTISVWNTSYTRPYVTTSETCAKAISDLTWSPDGESLYFTSLDGSIGALVFDKGELGYPAPSIEYDKQLSKFGAGRRVGIVENTDALLLEEGSKAGELRGVEGRMGELMGTGPEPDGTLVNGDTPMVDTTSTEAAKEKAKEAAPEPTPVPPPAPKDPQVEKMDKLKQRITITKDGKKRVAPLLLTTNQGEANLPRPQLQQATRLGTGPSDEPAKILDVSRPYDGLPRGGLGSLLIGNKRKYAEVADDGTGEDKRHETRIQAIQQNGATPIVSNTETGLVPASAATASKRLNDIPDVLRPAIINPSMTVSSIRLAVPQVRSVILRPLEDAEGRDTVEGESAVSFEARNATGPSRTGRAIDRDPTRITLTRRGQVLWQDFLPKAVLLVTGNSNFWAASCEDGSLHVWTPAGRRLLSPLVLEAQPVILDCRGWWLLAVTAVGQCYVWNMKTMSAPHPPVSLAPALDIAAQSQSTHVTHGPSVMFARLNSVGKIVVGMSSGDGFAYNPSMFVWQRLSETWWAVGSQYWNSIGTSAPATSNSTSKSSASTDLAEGIRPENISAGIIPFLERNTNSAALARGRAYALQRLVKQLLSAEGWEGLESSISMAHLENRLAATQTLCAKDEFKMYLVMYAKRIGSEGAKAKVEELLAGLMGNAFGEDDDDERQAEELGAPPGPGNGVEWSSTDEIVGWKRTDLLREVVVVLGKFRELQRVTVPYARLLGLVGELTVKGHGELTGAPQLVNGTGSMDTS